MSWKPDPGATAIDAFTLDWSPYNLVCFPPFSVIGKVLQQIQQHHATAIIVIPNWKTQFWYPLLMTMMMDQIQ